MTTDTEIVNAFLKAERHAREKHPVFADFFQNEKASDLNKYRKLLREIQTDNDRAERNHTSSAVGIISEELFEAFIAYVDGDLGQCISELNQLGGCVASAVRMVRNEKHKKEQNHAQAQAQNHPGEHGRKERPFRPHR